MNDILLQKQSMETLLRNLESFSDLSQNNQDILPDTQEYRSYLFEKVFGKILDYLEQDPSESKVVNYRSPAEIRKHIELSVGEDGVGTNSWLKLIDQYLKYSVNTGNKQFLNQLYSGFNLPAFLGEIITSLTNTSMYTYEVAPVATLVEQEMIKLMNEYSGYREGDGIFLSGGSNANLIAMFSARNRILPEGRFSGYDSSKQLTAFVNEQAHYSFDTAANLLGLGSSAVIKVKAHRDGRMDMGDLQEQMRASVTRGETPFFVAGTCATTLLGAYDPLDEIVKIAREYNAWVHADGSFGGSLIISDNYRHFFRGIELTDSFAWNPHKLMNIPLICSVLLVKDRKSLRHNFTDLSTDYIFHEIDGIEDLGEKSVQCGRRVDATKLWLAWQYYGKSGYQKRLNNSMEMAKYAAERVEKHPNLEMMVERQSFTVCFRYRPNFEIDLNDFNFKLRERMRKSGQSMVNYGYVKKQLTIRFVSANGELEREDIDQFFAILLQTAAQLSSETFDV